MKKPNSLLEDLKLLLPTIAANAFQAEEDRQVPAENIALLKSIGMHRAFQPKKFAGMEISLPQFADCSARFHCEKFQQVDGGDHWIMIGKVVAFDDFGRAPLLYHQGAYSMVLPHTRMTQREEGQPPRSHFQGRLSLPDDPGLARLSGRLPSRVNCPRARAPVKREY